MAVSEVSICSAALLKVGSKIITSLSDTSNEAKIVNHFYAETRDAVLRAHPWNFAVERAELVEVTPAPDFGFAKWFQLPTSPFCLRVLRFNDEPASHLINGIFVYDPFVKFKIEGRRLLTDESEAKIVYIKRVIDVTQFDSLFLATLEARLAAEIAFPISKNSKLVQTMWELYSAKLQEARTVDGMEGSPDSFESDEIGSVRR